MLRHSITGEVRYFHASFNNSRFFEEPFSIGDQEDMDKLKEAVLKADINEHGRRQRPDTKWVVHVITNMAVYVNKITNFIIGAAPAEVPDFVKYNRGLTTLFRSRHTGRPYKDNPCFFRCLALFRTNNPGGLERTTQQLLSTYRDAVGNQRVSGMTMADLSIAERVFETKIQVYSLLPNEEDTSTVCWTNP